MPSGARRLPYRPEIDGLRALAVLPVLLFHAGLAGFAGGYLGVDVFFVVSGYLITALILIEKEQGRFSLANFWARRARRILPLLSVVVLACLPAAWWLLGWRDIEDFWQSLVAVGLFASNILFWHEGPYFEVEAELKPLLHTWSLAVEEQFYLLFPLVCLAALRKGRRTLFITLCAVLALSATLFLLLRLDIPDIAFYWLPLRGWQLLAGSVCAFAATPTQSAASRPVNQVLALGGLALIAGAIAWAPSDYWTALMGPPALWVTLGAALVIRFGHAGTWAASALAWKPAVGLGLISYGAYLWHVPLLVFARHALALESDPELARPIELPMALALALCVVSVVLAALTWRWVERPFRDHARIPGGRALALGLAAWSIVAAFVATVALTDWQQRAYLTQSLGVDPEAAEEFLYHVRLNDRQPWTRLTGVKGECVFALRDMDEAARRRIAACRAERGRGVLVMGDSHAQGLHNILTHLVDERAFLVTVARGGCRLDRYRCFYPALERALTGPLADAFGEIVYTEAGSNRIVDAAGRPDQQAAFANPDAARIDEAALARLFERLAGLQATLADVPLRIAGPHYEPRLNLETAQPVRTGWVPRPTIRAQFDALDARYEAQAAAAGLDYISMMVGPLAPQDRALHAGCLLYWDVDHFSRCGEERMARRLREIGHPLTRLAE